MDSRGARPWLDGAMLVSVCALEVMYLTGTRIHEWLGAALAVFAMAHVLVQWPWIASRARRLRAPGSARTRVSYLLNGALFICMTSAIVSGFKISRFVLPGGALSADDHLKWHEIHDSSTTGILVFLGLHIALNWEWIAGVFRGRPAAREPVVAAKAQRPSIAVLRRQFARAAAVSVAVGIVAVAVYGVDRAMPVPDVFVQGPHEPLHRASVEERAKLFSRMPDNGSEVNPKKGIRAFAKQVVILGGLAFVGRKVLKLRVE